jgi:hypothetical protein
MCVASPFFGMGVQSQFWDQIERSSISFQGNGESAVPAAPPMANDKKLRRSIFIESSPNYVFLFGIKLIG